MAFSPTDPDIKWTNVSAFQIQQWLLNTYNIKVYTRCIRRCLKALGYVRRKPSKSIITGKSPLRAEQFLALLALSKTFEELKENPMISIDTKKKELIGKLNYSKFNLIEHRLFAGLYSTNHHHRLKSTRKNCP
jgi:Rhodopirellula transposase DDE domain